MRAAQCLDHCLAANVPHAAFIWCSRFNRGFESSESHARIATSGMRQAFE